MQGTKQKPYYNCQSVARMAITPSQVQEALRLFVLQEEARAAQLTAENEALRRQLEDISVIADRHKVRPELPDLPSVTR